MSIAPAVGYRVRRSSERVPGGTLWRRRALSGRCDTKSARAAAPQRL